MLNYRSIGWLVIVDGFALVLIACGTQPATPIAAVAATPVVPTQTAIIATEAPPLLPTATKPPCEASWMEDQRNGSPDLEAQIQQALAAEKISASVHSYTYGETDGCGIFHAASLEIEVTAQVKSISERAELEARATQIAAIVQRLHDQARVEPHLGRHQIIFVANNATCRWETEQRACQTY
jgi:hypothetical protein